MKKSDAQKLEERVERHTTSDYTRAVNPDRPRKKAAKKVADEELPPSS